MKAEAEARKGFEFAVMEDKGAVNSAADKTAKVIADLNYVYKNYETSPAYMRRQGRPVVLFFGVEALPVDWAKVRASVAGDPIFVFENGNGFTRPQAGGGFSWVGINGTHEPDLGYLNGFYLTGLKHPNEVTVGSVYKGVREEPHVRLREDRPRRLAASSAAAAGGEHGRGRCARERRDGRDELPCRRPASLREAGDDHEDLRRRPGRLHDERREDRHEREALGAREARDHLPGLGLDGRRLQDDGRGLGPVAARPSRRFPAERCFMAAERKRQKDASAEKVTPGLDPRDELGMEGIEPRTDEQKFAREAPIVDTDQVGDTVTGDEREITRVGDGALEQATGRDPTLGRDNKAPVTGAASAEALAEKMRKQRKAA